MSTVKPEKIEGLPTEGPMGAAPTLTVGGIIAIVSMVVTALQAIFGWELPPDLRVLADRHGATAAGLLVTAVALIQALWTYRHVFAPASVAERYRPKAASSIGPVAR